MPPKKAAAVAGNGGSSAGKDTKRKRGQADATTDDVANEVVYQPAKKAKPAPASKGKGRAKSPTTKPATKTPPKPRAPKPAAKKAQVTSKESKSKDVASKDATEPEPDLVKAALVKMEQAHEKKRKIAPSRSRKRAGVVGNPQVGAKREAPNAIKNDSDELLPEDEYPPAVFDKKGSLPIPKRYEQACKADRLALQWTQKGVARKKIAIRYSELVGREFQESNISSRVSRMESNFMQVRAQHEQRLCELVHEANQEWEKAKWATITERLNEAVNFEYRPDTLRTRYDELYRTGFTGLRANPLSEQPLERCADGGWPVIEPLPATTRADPAAVDDSDHESVEGHYLHTEPRPFGSTGARYDDYPNPPWKGGSNSSVSPITGNTGNPPPLIATPDNVAGTISNIMEQDPHAGLSAFASNQLLLQQQNVEGSHEASTPDDEGDQVNIVDAGIDIAGNDSNSEHSDDALVPPDPSSNVNDADAFSGFGDEEDPGAEEDVTASLAGNDDDGATIETPAIEEEATPDQRGTTEPGGNVDDTTNVEAAAHGGITSNHIDDIRDLPESSSRKKNWAERTHRPGLDDDDDD